MGASRFCKYFLCSNNNLNTKKTLFKAPNDDSLRKLWVENSGNSIIISEKDFYICECHFIKEDMNVDIRNRLAKLAIPIRYQNV